MISVVVVSVVAAMAAMVEVWVITTVKFRS